MQLQAHKTQAKPGLGSRSGGNMVSLWLVCHLESRYHPATSQLRATTGGQTWAPAASSSSDARRWPREQDLCCASSQNCPRLHHRTSRQCNRQHYSYACVAPQRSIMPCAHPLLEQCERTLRTSTSQCWKPTKETAELDPLSPTERRQCQLPIRLGGRGFRSQTAVAVAAWAGSWAQCLFEVQNRTRIGSLSNIDA